MNEGIAGGKDGDVCDNLKVIQFRRVALILLGIWLGAGIFADVAVTQNFQTVDRFLAAPGSASVSRELKEIGRPREREILRRNAGEENNFLFENWERAEIALGALLLAAMFFGERPNAWVLAGGLAMWVIVLVQHFLLSPAVAEMGRSMADLPDDKALSARFWMFHGIYSGAEIVKLLIGFVMAVRLSLRMKPDPNLFAKDFAKHPAGSQAGSQTGSARG